MPVPRPLKPGWRCHNCLGSVCLAPLAPARATLSSSPPSTHSSMPTSFSFFRLSPSPPYTATRLGMKFSSVVSTVSRSFLQKEKLNERLSDYEHSLLLPLIACYEAHAVWCWDPWIPVRMLQPFQAPCRARAEGQGAQGKSGP